MAKVNPKKVLPGITPSEEAMKLSRRACSAARLRKPLPAGVPLKGKKLIEWCIAHKVGAIFPEEMLANCGDRTKKACRRALAQAAIEASQGLRVKAQPVSSGKTGVREGVKGQPLVPSSTTIKGPCRYDWAKGRGKDDGGVELEFFSPSQASKKGTSAGANLRICGPIPAGEKPKTRPGALYPVDSLTDADRALKAYRACRKAGGTHETCAKQTGATAFGGRRR